jgi:hypothetical protein
MESEPSVEPQLRTYGNEQPSQASVSEPAANTLPIAELTITEPDLQTRIRDLAYQLYVQRGCIDGHDLDDWFDAESIVRQGEKLAA